MSWDLSSESGDDGGWNLSESGSEAEGPAPIIAELALALRPRGRPRKQPVVAESHDDAAVQVHEQAPAWRPVWQGLARPIGCELMKRRAHTLNIEPSATPEYVQKVIWAQGFSSPAEFALIDGA